MNLSNVFPVRITHIIYIPSKVHAFGKNTVMSLFLDTTHNPLFDFQEKILIGHFLKGVMI